MISSADSRLETLEREYPDWKPWLSVVEEVFAEAERVQWEAFVPARSVAQIPRVPLLAGLTLSLKTAEVRRWTNRLIQTAYQSGAAKMAALKQANSGYLNTASVFEAGLCQDRARLKQLALNLGVSPDALQAIAALIPVPFLQACSRRWASAISKSWVEGYCPVCAAWPAFAELRGIERTRYLRCSRCGGGWQVHCLFCPYCGMTDHRELESLRPEHDGATRSIETCKRCLGYVKSFTTLQGSPPVTVMIDDLASVDLDIAALNQNYRRPQGLGYSLSLSVIEKPSLNDRIFRWR